MAGLGIDPIVVTGLNHWFGAGEARKQALFDVNLTIDRGSLTVLLGASGSGKTTLLTLIGCLRQVQDGSVKLLGTELFEAGEATFRNDELGLQAPPAAAPRQPAAA